MELQRFTLFFFDDLFFTPRFPFSAFPGRLTLVAFRNGPGVFFFSSHLIPQYSSLPRFSVSCPISSLDTHYFFSCHAYYFPHTEPFLIIFAPIPRLISILPAPAHCAI